MQKQGQFVSFRICCIISLYLVQMKSKQRLLINCIFIVFCSGWMACGSKNTRKESPEQKAAEIRDTIRKETVNASGTHHDTLNFVDKNGLKQGIWKEYRNGKLFRVGTYKNGLKQGKETQTFGGEIHEYTYKNGKKNGLHTWRFSGREYYAVSMYENDSLVWAVFSEMILDEILSDKGPICYRESVPIKLYYLSGKLMYEGTITNEDTEFPGKGLHKVYYEGGKLKALADYDKQEIKIFKKSGKLHFTGSFEDWRMKGIRPIE